uniref:Uncharacterized protein n=1 Tax=Psilocybe cubensis TaxID=181762 RepID=A0A8H7XM66_PSICU
MSHPIAFTRPEYDCQTIDSSGSAQNWTLVKERLRILNCGKDAHGYSEFSGFGCPPLTLGKSGDIYLDLDPASINLYGRYTDEWKLWPGPHSRDDVLLHPIYQNRCLWCSETIGWQALNRVQLHQDKSRQIVIANSATYEEHQKYVKKRQILETNGPNPKRSKTTKSPNQSQASSSCQRIPKNSRPTTNSPSRFVSSGGQLTTASVRVHMAFGSQVIANTSAGLRSPIAEGNGMGTGEEPSNLVADFEKLKDVANTAVYGLQIAQQQIDRLKQENDFLRSTLAQLSQNDRSRVHHTPRVESALTSLDRGELTSVVNFAWSKGLTPSRNLFNNPLPSGTERLTGQTPDVNTEVPPNGIPDDADFLSVNSSRISGNWIPNDSLVQMQTSGAHAVESDLDHPPSSLRVADSMPIDIGCTAQSQALVNDKEAADLPMPPSSVHSLHSYRVESETEDAPAGAGIEAPLQLKLKLEQAHMSILYGQVDDFIACRLCRAQGSPIFEIKAATQDSRKAMERHLIEEHPVEVETMCCLKYDDLQQLKDVML